MFGAHGVYHVERKGEIVFVRASGAMNAEAAQAVQQAVCDAVEDLEKDNWAILVDTTEFELGTPDFEQTAAEAIKHFISIGLRKSAHVAGQGNLKTLQISNTVPGHDFYERRYFENKQQALQWLQLEGYHC